MSRDRARTALRYAAKNPGKAVLCNNGGQLFLAMADPASEEVAVLAERDVGTSWMAGRVHERFQQVLASFPHLSAVAALDAAIEYVRAAVRHASRRMGRLPC